jgi:hypothetical protein
MKYLCLIYGEEKTWDEMPKREFDALVDEHLAYDEALKQSGHFIVAEALERVETATIVRVRNGKLSVTDGPFAETKEQIGGFYLIDAPTIDAALDWASRVSDAIGEPIEVRSLVGSRSR